MMKYRRILLRKETFLNQFVGNIKNSISVQ